LRTLVVEAMTDALVSKVRELTDADPRLGYRTLYAKLQGDHVLQGVGIKKVQAALRCVNEERVQEVEDALEAADEAATGAKALKAAMLAEAQDVLERFATHCTFDARSDIPFSCEDGEYFSGGEHDVFTFPEGIAVGRPVQYQYSRYSSSGFSRYGGHSTSSRERVADGLVESVAQRFVTIKWHHVVQHMNGTPTQWKRIPQGSWNLSFAVSDCDVHMSFNGQRLSAQFIHSNQEEKENVHEFNEGCIESY